MDAIIAILNYLFDEKNTEFYIGDPNKLYSIHKNTNNILNNINKHSKHTTRKNKGIKMFDIISINKPIINIKYNIKKKE
jgi:hypothetical protein